MEDDEHAFKPREIKAGRRAGGVSTANPNNVFDGDDGQPTTKKGWGMDIDDSGKTTPPLLRESSQEPNYDADEQIEEVDPRAKDDDPSMAAIPDLEGETEEDLTKEIAEAPKNYEGIQVPKLVDLEKESRYFPLSKQDDGVDLSVLISVLPPLPDDEEDCEWDGNVLFSHLASEIQVERDAAEEANKKESTTTS
eukprot:TRINITY_DN37316_c0_g1_i1.p1 TRINITY_DN37316_c0_g1~~TRINITY_DN37316_c0_g1_i1.p1  ORF type:complete len:194 (+),score=31.36 TRINITY_DN37316_c0_g1_i1:71-652(+)